MSNPRTSKKTRLKGAERAFREASLFLGESGGFSLASAVFGHPVRREYWIRRLTETLAEVNVQLSHCQLPDSDDTRLVNVIAQHLNSVPTQPGFKRAVVVTGMSHQLPDAATSHRPGETAPRFLAEANLDRELFPQRCPHPLLLCVTPTALGQFTRFAPDLWHWCGHTFDFTEPALPDSSYPIRGIMELQECGPGEDYANRDELLRAAGIFRTGLDTAIAVYGAEHRETIDVRAKLVNVLHQLGRLPAAIELAEENFRIIESLQGTPEKVDTGHVRQYAQLLHQSHRLIEAERLMRRLLAVDQASLEGNDLNVAADLNNLALLLKDNSRLAEAEPLMRRSLAISQKSLGHDHPNVTIGLSNLASLLMATSRFAEAEPLIRQALAIDEARLGLNHPIVSLRLNNLSQLLYATNRLAEAEPLMRRALAIDETCFGSDHPAVARDLHNLASLLQDTDRFEDAESLMRRAIAISENTLGNEHPNYATQLYYLATLLHSLRRFSEAEPLIKRSLEISLKINRDTGYVDPYLRIAIKNYRTLLIKMGETEAEAKKKINAILASQGVTLEVANRR